MLCHDFGKPATTYFDPVKARLRSLGHDEAGVGPTLAFLERLTDETRILREVSPLVRNHMKPYAMWRGGAGENAIRRLAAEVVRIDRLARVAAADDGGRPPFPSNPEPINWLMAEADRLRIKDSAPKPIVLGRHLVEMGLKPGVKFGEILKSCYEAQLDGVFSDLKGGLKFCSTLPFSE